MAWTPAQNPFGWAVLVIRILAWDVKLIQDVGEYPNTWRERVTHFAEHKPVPQLDFGLH